MGPLKLLLHKLLKFVALVQEIEICVVAQVYFAYIPESILKLP